MTRTEEFSSKVRRIQNEIDVIRGNGTSHGIQMTVSPTGRILGLEIPPHAYDLSPRALSDHIASAHASAYSDANERARNVRAELAEDPRVRRILTET
ncbi:YbaB/EbfC family nucleoid-associated protein [Rhodococcus sp. HNM0563]|uniref:YbaB/EbfC family nucleoid-associated protein n=1 Tax=Rhodococcus sp. HNM0563 TaxID=2716339 RepID=UPI00146F24C8|nr:YbaB/EbfC family nucleoid-associated protein [Rhodococcus sp. HNM0563]